MKIEAGKFYKTRDGQKMGPISRTTAEDEFFRWSNGDYTWSDEGAHCGNDGCDLDLIAEWPDEQTGPVRTVTRREIVPGTYGRVRVWADMPSSCVRLGLGDPSGVNCYDFTADELRSMAMIFSQLAEALDENADNA